MNPEAVVRRGAMEPIRDHAVIGDCRSVALVTRHGVIDWLCWPRFDSPSIFGAILDDSAGSWRIAPSGMCGSERRYLGETNVLETRFHAAEGTLVLTDFMPVASEDEQRRVLVPDHEILRIVRCDEGTVDVDMTFEPRPRYGLGGVRYRQTSALGLRVETPDGLLVLHSEEPVLVTPQRAACARFTLRAGQERAFSLTFAHDSPAVLPPFGARPREALARTLEVWRR